MKGEDSRRVFDSNLCRSRLMGERVEEREVYKGS